MFHGDLQFTATSNLAMTDAAGQPPANNQKQSFRIMAQTPFQGTLPDDQTADTQFVQLGQMTGITRTITGDLGLPEVGSARWQLEEMTIMTMPETTIHLDHGTVARQPEIRLAWQGGIVQAIAKPGMMRHGAHPLLGTGIPATNTGHHLATLLGLHDICHNVASLVNQHHLLYKRTVNQRDFSTVIGYTSHSFDAFKELHNY